ncbi:MAG: hypothetical protein U0228_08920 [Myxococcaceae bacterium]
MTLVLLALLAAAPEAGSKVTWSLTEQRSLAGTVEGRKAAMDALPQLGKLSASVKVVTADGGRPTSLELELISGPKLLKGRVFSVELMSGELVMRDTKVQPTQDQLKASRALTPWVRALLDADPIVAAAESGARCDAAVRAKVLDALAHEVHRAVGADTPFELAPGGEATCPKKGTGWQVTFSLTLKAGEYTAVFPFKGTVDVGPKAWRASWNVAATSKFDMPGYGVKGKMTGQVTAASTFK